MSVLILAEDCDPTVDRVVLALSKKDVRAHRMDLGWFPDRLRVDAELDGDRWTGVLSTPGRDTSLKSLRSVWYRRPTPPRFPADMSQAARAHAEREARLGLGGVLATLPVLWVNHPARDADHAYKPRQLELAGRCGLPVPRTLITNDPHAARRFAGSTDHGVVIKVLGSSWLHDNGKRMIAHTHRLTPADLTDLDGIALTTHQIQEWVPKQYEVRLIVVGRQMFAVAIRTTDPDAHVDWRANYDALDYTRIDVPPYVARAVGTFMTAATLNFSALDFVVTPENEWVFLESNSGGQYGWLATALGNTVSDALAGLLAQGQTP